MASRYVHNYAAFDRECLCAGFMVAEMHARAERVKAAAIAISPQRTGHYKASFEVSSGVSSLGGPEQRAYGRVANTAAYAPWVEFGSKRIAKHRVLGRALHAAG